MNIKIGISVLIISSIFFHSGCSQYKHYSCPGNESKSIENSNFFNKKIKVLESSMSNIFEYTELPIIDSILTIYNNKVELYKKEYQFIVINVCMDNADKERTYLFNNIQKDIEELEYISNYLKNAFKYKGINGNNIEEVNYFLNKRIVENITISNNRKISFDYPPPFPTSRYEIKPIDLGIDKMTYDLIDKKLKNSLENSGYEDIAYHYIQNIGVAVITKFERFNKNGTPYSKEGRFDQKSYLKSNSFFDYLSNLIYGNDGYYRVYLFLLTEEEVDNIDNNINEDYFNALLVNGRSSLPKELRLAEEKTDIKLYCYVYEFYKRKYHETVMVTNSSISAKQHLQASNIINNDSEK